jgi:hypothetical protein
MTRKEFNLYKEQFEREGYIHESVVKELFETIEQQFTAKKEEEYVEIEPGC